MAEALNIEQAGLPIDKLIEIRMAELEEVNKQRDALLAALKKYGKHLQSCDTRFIADARSSEFYKECTCGFDQAIADKENDCLAYQRSHKKQKCAEMSDENFYDNYGRARKEKKLLL